MSIVTTRCELFDVDILQKLVTKDGISHKDKLDLQRYKKRRINGNEVLVSYAFPKHYSTIKMGRVYSTPRIGLEAFPKDIRAALAQKYYWDIDMVNAQPVLLCHLAKKMGVRCDALQEYCNRRVEILEELIRDHNYNREEAKQLCVSVIFGGWRDHHPLLPRMFGELKTLGVIVAEQNPELFAIAKKDKDMKDKHNPNGSCLAIYIQNEERIILQHLMGFFESKGRSMDVLIFDGGLLRKLSGEEKLDLTLLREAEQYILEKTGYEINLLVKPLEHTFDFKEKELLIPPEILINDEYAAKSFVRFVGERLRKVDGSLWVLNADGVWSDSVESLRLLVAEHSSQLVFRQQSPTGIKTYDYGGNEDKIPKLLKQTMLHASVGTLPLQLAYSMVESSSESPEPLQYFHQLIEIISNHEAPLTEYLLNWLAHTLQKPFEIPGVALIVTGRKGYGKDTLFDFFGKYVLGSRYFSNYTDNNQFFDHYDTGKLHRLMVKLEEADRTICLKNSSVLKGMITADQVVVNPKNKQSFQASNYCRFVLTTNKGNPVEFSDGERRYVLFASSGEKKGNIDYWTAVRNVLFTDMGGKIVAEYLLQRDITMFSPQRLPPNTYQEAVIESEISIEERFIDNWDGEDTDVKDLFRQCNLFCRENSYPQFENLLSFGRRLLPLVRDGKLIRRKSHSHVYYSKPGVVSTAQFVEE